MARTEACPNCGKAAAEKYVPFCSKHCADVDLGRWFNGSYAVPVVEEDESAQADDSTSPDAYHS